MSKHLLVTAIVAAGVVVAAPAAAPGKNDLVSRTEAALPGLDLGARATPARRAVKAYAELPLAFEPNIGQTDARVRFSAQTAGASFFFTRREAVISLRQQRKNSVLRLRFFGANPYPAVEGQVRLAGKVNYLLGNDPAKWHTGVPTYGEIVYRRLWPGIDLAFRGNGRALKYEFRVAAGADPSAIRLAYRGARGLSVDRHGRLVIRTGGGVLRDARPVSYQEIGGKRSPVASRFVLEDGGYGFALGRYDRTRPLVVDPGLVYSTYLSGTGHDPGFDIAVDASGSAYITGFTTSGDFPTASGAFDTSHNGNDDVFVTKLNANGSALSYSTYFGGSAQDQGWGIAVDDSGSAYVTGFTLSGDFPTTAGAFDTTYSPDQIFVTKLSPTGSALAYSTYLGSTYGMGRGIAVDASGNAYVTGWDGSAGLPTTAGAFDTIYNAGDAFVTKLNTTGSALAYSTYLGGSNLDESFAITVDASGSAYVTGRTFSSNFPTTAGAFDATYGGDDAFVTKFNASGSAVAYSTYLGGSGGDVGFGIAVDSASSSTYVTGFTFSGDFPTTAGAFDMSHNGHDDAFVTKLNASGSAPVYSTYLGGSSQDQGLGIAVDASGVVYVTGFTFSGDFPTTADAFDTTYNAVDAFVTKLNASGSAPGYSTYLGGSSQDEGRGIAVDASGVAYITGFTFSGDFPTTAGAFDTTYGASEDAFVTKLSTTIGAPATLTLSPAADTNPVGMTHTVTATVTDAWGSAVPNVVVRFTVTGSVSASGSCTTGANGQCSFAYHGPNLPGADLIAAFADTNGNGSQDLACPYLPCQTEPGATATKAWVVPFSTAGEANGGGQIQTAAGSKISFGFHAKSAGGLQGGCNVVEHGGRMIKCMDVTALVLSGNQATIYGNATDNGAATTYVIHAVDNADPGKGADTFSIQTASGYSASGTLTAGNVQVSP